MLNSSVRGLDQHQQMPFTVGHIFAEGPFIHVLDEFSLEFIMAQFDTAPDFIGYVRERERLFSGSSPHFTAEGEEELASGYILNHAYGRLGFLPMNESDAAPDYVHFAGGLYDDLLRRPEYVAKRKLDEESRGFDRLVERFALHGEVAHHPSGLTVPLQPPEEVLRVLASEGRFRRRQIYCALAGLIKKTAPESSAGLMRVFYSRQVPDRVYVLGVVARHRDESSERFRARRQKMLLDYCECVQLKFPSASTVVGVCIDSPASPGPHYEDLVVLRPPPLTPLSWVELERYRQSLGILSERMETAEFSETEYPSVA